MVGIDGVLLRGGVWLVAFMCVAPDVAARRVNQDDIEQTRVRPAEPVVTYVDYEAEAQQGGAPARLPYPENGVIPEGYVLKEKRRLVRWLPGLVAVVALPMAGAGVAWATTMDSAWIPVAGPFMAMGEYVPMERSPGSSISGFDALVPVFAQLGTYTLLGIDGVVQIAGWGLLGYSLLNPDRRYLVREDLARSYFVPTPVNGGWAMSWVGTF